MQNKLHKLQSELNSAYQHLKQGTDPGVIIKRLTQLLRKWSNQPDIVHLLALAYKQDGDFKNAEQKFKLALSIDSKNPQILNNLANLYKKTSRFTVAIEYYKRALIQQPGFNEARKNLGLCYHEMADYSSAINALQSIAPADASSLTALANSIRESGDFQKADNVYDHVLQSNPNYVNAWYNRGVNYHRHSDLNRAKSCYLNALKIDKTLDVGAVSLSLLLKEDGDLNGAIEVLEEAVKHVPNSAKLVSTLNEMLWESGNFEAFTRNINTSLSLGQKDLDIQIVSIGQLINAGLFDDALRYTDDALTVFGPLPQLVLYRGQLLAEATEFDAAYNFYEKSLDKRFDRAIATEQIKLSIILERYERAQFYLDSLLESDSHCQLTWALQSLVWKFTNFERYEWLNRGGEYIRSFKLQTPNGYSSADSFLNELRDVLLKLHQTSSAPLEQTLRNGTQTAAKLFERNDPIISQFKWGVQDIVQSYVDLLKREEGHPFLSRKSSAFSISGSWSVKLKTDGFHVNHVHPAGWISSSSYIHLPQSGEGNLDDQAGAIKFGESPLSLGERETIDKVIQPEPGMIVLFPSFTWHGTVPFTGSETQYRLTAPFDVLPS